MPARAPLIGGAVVAALAACGGKAPPSEPPAPAPAPAPVAVAKRVPIEDSEPEEGVTVLNAKGHMDQAAVEAGIAPHRDALGACYTARVGRRRWLGGKVTLHWDIKANGTIASVKLAESDLGAWPIEKCLVEVAKGATFGKPIGGDADFTLPLEFSAKGGALAWDEDKALRAIGGQLAKLDTCKKHGLPDDVTVTLYVGPHGKAQSVGFSSGRSEIDEKWAECAAKAATAWRLPDPRGQVAKLAIRYRAQPGGGSGED